MRYLIISLCLLMILPFCGCQQGTTETATPTASAVNTPVPEPTKAEGSTGTTSEALVIPAAEKIKPELKEEVDKILPSIGGEDWQASSAATEKLDKICEKNKTDLALFAYLTENPNADVAYTGVSCIYDCEDKTLVPEMFDILTFAIKHKSDHVRSKAWDSLRWISDNDELKGKLKELARNSLEEPSGIVRATVVDALAFVDDKESAGKIKEIMNNDKAPQVVASAIQGLNSMGEDITEDLVKILDTGTPYVKCYAIYVLAEKKNKDIIPTLVKMLDDKTETFFSVDYDNGTPMSYNSFQPTLQKMAVQGLETITGEKFKGAKDDDIDGIVKKWKEWGKKNVK